MLAKPMKYASLARLTLSLVSLSGGAVVVARAEANGGARGTERPQETIRRKILLSCRNFCDLND